MRWGLVAALLAVARPVRAEDSGFGLLAGVGMAGAEFKDLNLMVDEYNDTRDWLDKDLRTIHFLFGPEITGYFHVRRLFVELGLWRRGVFRQAGGVDVEGNDGRREVRLREGSVSFGVGLVPVREDAFLLAIGLDADIAHHKEWTRSYVAGEDKTDWTRVHRALAAGLTFWVNGMLVGGDDVGPALSFKPFVHYSFIPWNHAELEFAMNPATNQHPSAEDNPVMVGLVAQVGLGFRGD